MKYDFIAHALVLLYSSMFIFTILFVFISNFSVFFPQTHDEFLKYTGLTTQSRMRSKLNSKGMFQCQETGALKSSAHDIPDELDWSAQGYTTP